MAITYADKFKRDCKAAFQEAMYRGDKQRAEEIRNYYEERKYSMNYDDMKDVYMQALNTGLGIGQIGMPNNVVTTTTGTGQAYQSMLAQQAQAQVQNIAKADFKPEFGVLYLHNKELPADWAGAKITEFQRRMQHDRWHLQFRSKWDKELEIDLYLDVEEHNGKEINEAARTYMEALNQRRVG